MSLLQRLFTRRDPREALIPLYNAVVVAARQPHWYREGQVPDTIDGRFDMIALLLSLTLIRLEDEADQRQNSAWLTEVFVDDMDGQMRQIGFGDMVVGKRIGEMMAALGGRLTVYRAAPDSAELREALQRNLWRGDDVAPQAMAHVAVAVSATVAALVATPTDALIAGRFPDISA